MPAHPPLHLTWTIGFLGAAAALLLIVRARPLRRRVLFGAAVLAAAVVVYAATFALPHVEILANDGRQIERLLTAFGVIAIAVALVFNPWFGERPGETTPAIVQDAIVAILAVIASMFVFQSDNFFVGVTGSAIVVGLALQDTLGNAFAGLAIQVEKPFRVGHWIATAGYEGRVVEVTWRATKIRTKPGNLVVLPNSMIAKEAINNYSEPTPQTRLTVEVGAAYGAPPNKVKQAMLACVRHSPLVLETPPPDVMLHEFGDSAISYRLRFWTTAFEKSETICDEIRRAIYYEFSRQDIEIPWPIRVVYHREDARETAETRADRHAQLIARVPVLAPLGAEGQRALALAATERLYGAGERIVGEGDTSDSMFIVCSGEVAIVVGGAHEVARTGAGGYFGEMSLLTGEPRSATVVARSDCTVLEIGAQAFKAYVTRHPDVIEQLADAAAGRRRQLDETKAAAAAGAAEARVSLAARMRKFFGLG